MAVASTVHRNDYVASGGQTSFAVTFQVLAAVNLQDQVTVWKNGAQLTYSTHWTVSGSNVVLTSGATAGDAIAIVRAVTPLQPAVYTPLDKFPAKTHEGALDRAALVAQQTLAEAKRAARRSPAHDGEGPILPAPEEANALIWGADGNLANREIEDVDTALAYAQQAQASAEAAGTSETNAAVSELKANLWADEAEDVPVETGPDQFSAFHWAQKARAGAHQINGIWYVSTDPAIIDHGDEGVVGSLAWTVAQVGEDMAQVVLPPVAYAMTTPLIVPGNVKLSVLSGAVFSGNITFEPGNFLEGVRPEWFGAVADSGSDAVAALTAAAGASAEAEVPVLLGPGEYRTSATVSFSQGVRGSGAETSKIQAINSAAHELWIVAITGGGIYEDFSVDGAVSADPGSWDSGTYDSFTGWRGIGVLSDNVTLRNVSASNTWRAGFSSSGGRSNLLFDNCHAVRARGNFGDCFYLPSCNYVVLNSCTARDFTRIGFVLEGGSGVPSRGAVFNGCTAEFGHNRSTLHGGGEYNAGFWAENTTSVQFNTCRTLNSGAFGFVFAGGLGGTADDASAPATFIGCTVENLSPPVPSAETFRGFSASSLSAAADLMLATLSGCVTKFVANGFAFSDSGFSRIVNCSFRMDGPVAPAQARAVAIEGNANVTIDGFFEQWTNRPTARLINSADAEASIGTFSGAALQPGNIVVKDWKSHDGFACVIKLPVSAGSSEDFGLHVERSKVSFVGNCRRRGPVRLVDCVVDTQVFGMITENTTTVVVRGCTIQLGASLFIGSGAGFAGLFVSDSLIARASGDHTVTLYRLVTGVDNGPLIRVSNSRFVGDITAGGLLRQSGESDVRTEPGQGMVVTGCAFVNTGGSTADPAIIFESSSLSAGRLHASGVWKSSSITNIVKSGWLATGSSVNNLDA